MLLGLYLLVMLFLLMGQLVNSYIGWIILGIVAVVSYITTVSLAHELTRKKRLLFASIGFVLISTVMSVGLLMMKQHPIGVSDYLVPLFLVFCHPIARYIKRENKQNAK